MVTAADTEAAVLMPDSEEVDVFYTKREHRTGFLTQCFSNCTVKAALHWCTAVVHCIAVVQRSALAALTKSLTRRVLKQLRTCFLQHSFALHLRSCRQALIARRCRWLATSTPNPKPGTSEPES